MNGFRLISSKAIIAEMYSDFNITNDDWVNKAYRHISRALGIMRIDGYYEIAYHLADVVDFNAPLPCDQKYLLTVLSSVNGCVNRLPLTHDLGLGLNFSQIAFHSSFRGRVNFNSLRTNFQEGQVLYIYHRVPRDSEGYPLIPDNEDVLEALPYFLIYKTSLSGYKHPVISIDVADSKWKELYPKARNSMNFPSIEEMHSFSQSNTNPFYANAANEEWGASTQINATDIVNFINKVKEENEGSFTLLNP